MIHGVKVNRRPDATKGQITKDIAQALSIDEPAESGGSSIDSKFLNEIHEARTGYPMRAGDTYRTTERVMQAFDLTYDPWWDTSENAPKGGGTVTTRAFSRIRTEVTGVPRCFIINTNDAPVGSRWETDHERRYRYDDSVSGRIQLNDAGPGSRVLYYSTSKSSQNAQHFTGHAEVHYIASGWEGPWEAQFDGYQSFAHPVAVSNVDIPGWNRQNAITEITFDTYCSIVDAGGLDSGIIKAHFRHDAGSDIVAQRVQNGFPATPSSVPSLGVPDQLPPGRLQARRPPRSPEYRDTDDGRVVQRNAPPRGVRTLTERKRDKLAELRAVDLATAALEADGWTMSRDCQADGVGYDLEFERDGRLLKVEVKGVQGVRKAFNLTPKEWWRAETDPKWVVVVVTSVLSPSRYQLHLLTRKQVVEASRMVTGYRLNF